MPAAVSYWMQLFAQSKDSHRQTNDLGIVHRPAWSAHFEPAVWLEQVRGVTATEHYTPDAKVQMHPLPTWCFRFVRGQ